MSIGPVLMTTIFSVLPFFVAHNILCCSLKKIKSVFLKQRQFQIVFDGAVSLSFQNHT